MSSAAACSCISSTAPSEHAGEAYKTVRARARSLWPGLGDKPEIVALTKADALTPEQLKQQAARLKRAGQEDAAGRFGGDRRRACPRRCARCCKMIDEAGGDQPACPAPSRPGSRRHCTSPKSLGTVVTPWRSARKHMLNNALARQWCRVRRSPAASNHVPQSPRPHRFPPHRRQGRLVAAGRRRGRPR